MKYVCVLSSDNYLNGVLILNENLKAVNSKYGLLCLINESISEETKSYLEYFGIEYKLMNKIEYKCESETFVWKNTFDKLNIFSLIEYKKLIYLDSDMLILDNLDHLFKEKHITMTSNLPYQKENNNSSIMVVVPNMEDYNNLLKTLAIYDRANYNSLGDQDIINACKTGLKKLQIVQI